MYLMCLINAIHKKQIYISSNIKCNQLIIPEWEERNQGLKSLMVVDHIKLKILAIAL